MGAYFAQGTLLLIAALCGPQAHAQSCEERVATARRDCEAEGVAPNVNRAINEIIFAVSNRFLENEMVLDDLPYIRSLYEERQRLVSTITAQLDRARLALDANPTDRALIRQVGTLTSDLARAQAAIVDSLRQLEEVRVYRDARTRFERAVRPIVAMEDDCDVSMCLPSTAQSMWAAVTTLRAVARLTLARPGTHNNLWPASLDETLDENLRIIGHGRSVDSYYGEARRECRREALSSVGHEAGCTYLWPTHDGVGDEASSGTASSSGGDASD